MLPADGSNELYRLAKNDIAFESQGPFRIPTLRQVNASLLEISEQLKQLRQALAARGPA